MLPMGGNSMNLRKGLGGLLVVAMTTASVSFSGRVLAGSLSKGTCYHNARDFGLWRSGSAGGSYGYTSQFAPPRPRHRKNTIALTFTKELDPNNNREILLLSRSSIAVAYPALATAQQKYFYYFLVTLVLPTELRAIDGSSLANDSFFGSLRAGPPHKP